MKNTNLAPRTYGEVLDLAKVCDVISWFRANQTLSLVFDDKTADRRTCLELSAQRGKAGTLEIKTLSGFDPVKNRWSDYCAPCGQIALENKRGQKDLLDWIRTKAQERTGWPNPESFTIYKTKTP